MFDGFLSDALIHENLEPVVDDNLKVLAIGKLTGLGFLIDDGCVCGINQVFYVTVAPANELALSIEQKRLFFFM